MTWFSEPARPPRRQYGASAAAGFTLLEILIVLVILGLVAAVVERFATEATAAREDVRGFLALLRARGLVVEA